MTAEEEAFVVDELRRSHGYVSVGGSRCHTEFAFQVDGLRAWHFDEGHIQEIPCALADLLGAIRQDPDAFAHLLAKRPAAG